MVILKGPQNRKKKYGLILRKNLTLSEARDNTNSFQPEL